MAQISSFSPLLPLNSTRFGRKLSLGEAQNKLQQFLRSKGCRATVDVVSSQGAHGLGFGPYKPPVSAKERLSIWAETPQDADRIRGILNTIPTEAIMRTAPSKEPNIQEVLREIQNFLKSKASPLQRSEPIEPLARLFSDKQGVHIRVRDVNSNRNYQPYLGQMLKDMPGIQPIRVEPTECYPALEYKGYPILVVGNALMNICDYQYHGYDLSLNLKP